jgi:hypothetical protein
MSSLCVQNIFLVGFLDEGLLIELGCIHYLISFLLLLLILFQSFPSLSHLLLFLLLVQALAGDEALAL